MREELLNLREAKQESDIILMKKDKRSIRPIPATSSGEVNKKFLAY